ncbi:MAG: zinc-binding alcohol dehydrogenase family protein [Terracidiphilus sp.]|jgi:NADPH:quinone reductase-like Zn-dependent oxidoreductase
MHAAVVNTLGQLPQYQQFPEPVPGENEALVQVLAAGLHPIVKARASGMHYSSDGVVPFIPGVDGVGVLDGNRVFFGFSRAPFGSMAERTVVRRSMCVRLPDGIDDVHAAAIANPGMSAWVSMKERAHIAPGETVLILGATGVAGQLAIQVARHLGAKRVIGVGRNVEAISASDVDTVIGLSQPGDAVRDAFAAEAAKGIDVVIDYLWGRPTELLLEALAKGFKASATHSTRLIEVGESAGRTISLPGGILRSVDLTLKGSGFGSAAMDVILAAIPTLFSLAAEGKLKIDVEPVPLADVETAWPRSDKGRRIVFTI